MLIFIHFLPSPQNLVIILQRIFCLVFAYFCYIQWVKYRYLLQLKFKHRNNYRPYLFQVISGTKLF